MKIIEKNSTFTLFCDFTLSSTDEEVLSLLYQPLSEPYGYCLYRTLYSLALLGKEQGFFTYESLTALTHFEDSVFLDSRSRLEAIGLLETYRKENKATGQVLYLYKLLPPATPRKFFGDVLLSAALASVVSPKEVHDLKRFFKVSQSDLTDGYVNVSVPFSDIFSVNPQEVTLADTSALAVEKKYKSQATFSLPKVFDLIQKDGLSVTPFVTASKDIQETASLYGLTERQGADLLEKNTSTDNIFVFTGFLKDVKALKKYQVVSQETPTDGGYLGEGATRKYLEIFCKLAPLDYLALRYNAQPLPEMVDEVAHLKKDTSLSDPVINVILDYSLRKTHGEFKPLYIDKVALTLSAQSVGTAYQAMTALNSRDFEMTKATAKKAKTSPIATSKDGLADPETSKDALSDQDIDTLAKDLKL